MSKNEDVGLLLFIAGFIVGVILGFVTILYCSTIPLGQ